MFILTNGKSYIMKNPIKQQVYIGTTSAVQAKEFIRKQAKSLLNNKKKSKPWIRLSLRCWSKYKKIDNG